MIKAVHTLVYADDPAAARAFFRDVLGWPSIDAHDGWLIFNTGPSEMGVHPTSVEIDGKAQTLPQHHEITLLCDDIEKTVADLEAKGAKFTEPIQNQGFGRVTRLAVPGAGDVLVYEPRHLTAFDL